MGCLFAKVTQTSPKPPISLKTSLTNAFCLNFSQEVRFMDFRVRFESKPHRLQPVIHRAWGRL